MSTKILTPEKNVLTSNLRNNIRMMRIFFWLISINIGLSFNVFAENAPQKTDKNLQKIEANIQKKLEVKVENIEKSTQRDKIDQASAPKPPMLSGNIDVYGGYNNSKFPHEVVVAEEATQNRPYAGIDGVINFKAITSFNEETNLRYGLTSEIDFDSFDQSNPINLMEANFIISSKQTATRMFGLHRPVTSKMNINSASFAPYSNGIIGKWQDFIKYPSFSSNANNGPNITTSFITTPGSPIQSGFASQQFLYNAEREVGVQPYEKWGGSMIGLSYISERMAGFRVGASFFPDNKASVLLQKKDLIDQKNLQILNSPSSVYLKNILAIGTNYYNYFGDIEVSFSGGFEYASSVSSYAKKDLTSYSIGLNLGYLGIMVGGSFTNYGNSLQIKSDGISNVIIGNNYYYDKEKNLATAGNAYVFDVGLGYSVDRFTINLAYLQSKYVGSKFWAGIVSFETKVTKDFINYIQIGKYKFTPPTYQGPALPEARETDGYIFLVGMKYIF